MPLIAVVGAVISTVVAVATPIIATVGTVIGAIGAAIATPAVWGSVAVGATGALIKGAMEKKALKKSLSIQESAALRNYEIQNKALAQQEQQAISDKIAAEKAAEEKTELEARLLEQAEEQAVISAKAQQIETLANLNAAQFSYRPPAAQPVFYTAPQPVSQRIGFFDSVNTSIHKFFGSW